MTQGEGHQQQLEQRQREEEEAQDRINAYADAMIRADKITFPISGAGDCAPDGRNLSYWTRNVIVPQREAILEKYERTRKKK